jgi:lipopolysaccharide transport system permease protein
VTTPAAPPPAAQLRTVLRPTTGWVSLNLRELWAYRDLLYFFVWRDVKVRYRQTVFGALWAILQPLLLMVVFTVFLGRISGIATEGIPYPLFAYSALVPWALFSSSLISSSSSLVGSSNLVQKVYFPRLLLPIAAVGSYLLDFVMAMLVLGLLMLWFGLLPTGQALWVLPLTLLAIAASLAVGIWLAAVNVRYRDVRFAVPFLIQLWLFASPIAYASDLVPDPLQGIFRLNPMAGVIDGFRWALLGAGSPPPVESVLASVVVTGLVLLTGMAYFRRVERTFADII